jgi:hypothetical protein
VDYKIMIEGLQMIGQFFGEDYKPDAIKAVQNAILLEPDAAMTSTYKRAVVEFPQRFLPPLSKVRDIIIQEGRKIREAETVEREREAERTKAEERKPWAPPNDPHGKACAKFLQAAFSGMYSHDELRVMADEGEKKFPGRGFDVWLKGALKPKVVEPKQRAAGEAA